MVLFVDVVVALIAVEAVVVPLVVVVVVVILPTVEVVVPLVVVLVVVLMVVALGAARSFVNPTMNALMPGLVSEAEFPRAAAVAASSMQAAFIIGPALGGLLYAFGAGAGEINFL